MRFICNLKISLNLTELRHCDTSGLMWFHYAVFRLTKSEPLGGAKSYKIIIITLQGVYHLCVYECVCECWTGMENLRCVCARLFHFTPHLFDWTLLYNFSFLLPSPRAPTPPCALAYTYTRTRTQLFIHHKHELKICFPSAYSTESNFTGCSSNTEITCG